MASPFSSLPNLSANPHHLTAFSNFIPFKLSPTNFPVWKIQITQPWVTNDQLTMVVLISSFTEPILVQVSECKTAAEIWALLHQLYSAQSTARIGIVQARLSLASLRKGAETITDYFKRARALVASLTVAGQHISDHEFSTYLLAGLDEKPILILTHGDKLSAEERIEYRLKICRFLGIPEATGAYDVVCLTEQGVVAEDSDPVTAYAVTEAVYRAVLSSDRGHLPKIFAKDRALVVLSWLLWLLGALFACLARIFSYLARLTRT